MFKIKDPKKLYEAKEFGPREKIEMEKQEKKPKDKFEEEITIDKDPKLMPPISAKKDILTVNKF